MATNSAEIVVKLQEASRAPLMTEAPSLAQSALNVDITNADEYVAANYLFNRVCKAEKAVHSLFDEICDGANQLHKLTTEKRGMVLKPLETAKAHLSRLIGQWDLQQRELAEKERRRLEQEALDAAAEEAKRIEASRAAQAQTLEQSGDLEGAELVRLTSMLEQEQVVTDAVSKVVAPQTVRVEGTTVKDNWTFEILNPDAVPYEYCSPDPKKIRGFVSLHKARAVGRIPGVRVFNDTKAQRRTVPSQEF